MHCIHADLHARHNCSILCNYLLGFTGVEILRLLSLRLTNRDIAERLFISEKPFINRLSLVFRKLTPKNWTQAALYVRKSLTDGVGFCIIFFEYLSDSGEIWV